jgi:hypothetical protein
VASGGLAIKHKAASLKFSNDLPVTEPGKTPHLGGDHDRVVTLAVRGRQVWGGTSFSLRLDQLSSHIAGDFERFGYSPALATKPGNSCEVARTYPSGSSST